MRKMGKITMILGTRGPRSPKFYDTGLEASFKYFPDVVSKPVYIATCKAV